MIALLTVSVVVSLLLTVTTLLAYHGTAGRSDKKSFAPKFGTSGLVTNEHAYWTPQDPSDHRSRDWTVTSGSLFARDGAGWTGVPDRVSPNADSSNGTDSAVFRMTSARIDFVNVRISFLLRVNAHVVGNGVAANSYDGVHVWVHHLSETELYAVSVMRWDGLVVVKRKTTGGDNQANGGSYGTIGQVSTAFPIGHWVPIVVESREILDGSVEITLWESGSRLLDVRDSPLAALTAAGAIGIRGDNTEFEFKNFRAVAIDPVQRQPASG